MEKSYPNCKPSAGVRAGTASCRPSPSPVGDAIPRRGFVPPRPSCEPPGGAIHGSPAAPEYMQENVCSFRPPPPPPPPKPPGRLQKGDLLMLAILWLVLSEDEDDKLLPLLAVGLYLLLK